MISSYIAIGVFAALAAVPPLILVGLWFIRRNRAKRIAALELLREFEDRFGDLRALREIKLPARIRFFPMEIWPQAGIASYYLLLMIGISLFYFSGAIKIWRIRRNLIESGIAPSINIDMSSGDAILTGNVATLGLAIRASRRAAEIVGAGRVVNELTIEDTEILGSDSALLGEAEVVVNTAYDDWPESLREIGAILTLPQFETVHVSRALTVASFIAKRYGITRSKLPQSFEMLASKIGKLNTLNRPGYLHSGTVNAPILPTRFAVPGSRSLRAAKRQEPGFLSLLPAGLAGGLEQVGIGRSLRPVGSGRLILNIPFTRGTAQQTQRLGTVLPFSVLSSNMRIEFDAAGEGAGLHEILNDPDKKAIVNALKQEPQRTATVFILDAGWPDDAAYRTSLEELRRLVNQARKFYQLNDGIKWETPMTPEEFSNTELPQHCVEIEHSLKEFTDLDQKNLVKVVYVPLSRKQKSDQILTEIWAAYWLRDHLANDIPLDPQRKSALSIQANAWALEKLKGLSPNSEDLPDAPQSEKTADSYEQTWETDSSLVAAIWSLADLDSYLHADRPVYFLNESWTVLPDKIHLVSPARSYGIVVAAVGNADNIVVNKGKGQIEFARLATPANNVLAALDAKQDSDSPDCHSAMLAEEYLDKTMASGFDGIVTDSSKTDKGVCGSSFSAPRIAWILALSEAIRIQYEDKDDWADSVQQKLLKARAQGPVHQWQKLYLHPQNILP